MHFIEFVVVETRWFVGSNVNVILIRQTCSVHTSRAAGGKRQALALYCCMRILYMFWRSKCRGESDLCLCTTPELAKRMRLCSADFRLKPCLAAKFVGSRHCAAAFFLQIPKLCTDLDWTLLCILIMKTYTKFVWKNKILALGVCLPQPCWTLDAGLPRQDHVYSTSDELCRFHNQKFDEMRCKLDSTENPRSFAKYPTPH